MGRFITPDSFVQDPLDPQTLNRYTYCRNNPLIYIDPSGHFFFGVIIAAVIGAVMGGIAAHQAGGNVLAGVLFGALVGAVSYAWGSAVVASMNTSALATGGIITP